MAHPHTHQNRLWILGFIPLAITGYLITFIPETAEGHIWSFSTTWVSALNIDLAFRLDGLSLLMSLLVLGVGGLILIYASGYMSGHSRIHRFYIYLCLFMAAMWGVVTADNIFLLFIFWELTSISSYLLISFNHQSPTSQRSAQQALLITGSGGMALMAGLVLLGTAAGSWQLSEILKLGHSFHDNSLYTAVLVLVLLGAFTKSAQFPFHFWLPNAMAAPTPVSAYLHSATMVKAGIYLLARLNPVLGETPAWMWTLVIVGGITGCLGGWLAWQQSDLKRIMAYTTISALGILVFMLGVGGKIGVKAAVLFLVVHSLYKGALFMTAGAVDHETGTRDITQLGGLMKTMPITFSAVALATLSMAGLPPLVGFIGKELIYEATVESHMGPILITAIAFLMNMFNVAAAFIILIQPFIKEKPADSKAKKAHEAPWTLWLGPIVLGVTAVLMWIFAESHFVSEQLIQSAVTSVYGKDVEVHLHRLPATFNIVPILSLITIAAGLAWWAIHTRIRPQAVAFDQAVSRFGPESGYFNGLDGLLNKAAQITNLLQNGYMRRYLAGIIITLLLLVSFPLFTSSGDLHIDLGTTPRLYELILALVIMAGGLMVVIVQERLAAVASLGIVGYGIAIFFTYFNAPDLAMTQFAIETLSVIIFVLVLYRLPGFDSFTSNAGRARDAIIAGGVGLLMMMLVLYVTAVPTSTHLSDYYAEFSYTLAKGTNVVNVILVDFRGMDTMIEVSVLAVAAIGVYALVTRESKLDESTDSSEKGDVHD